MAKKIIDIGSSPNKGDGDPIRTAFDKINENFTELYDRDLNTDGQVLSITGDTLSISNGNSVDLSKYVDTTFSGDYNDLTNKPVIPTSLSELSNDTGFITVNDIPTDFKGSVFADDSTLLVDAVNGVIPYSVLDNTPTALSDFSNDLDYAAIVATQIQTNGLPVDTTATGNLTVNGNLEISSTSNIIFETEQDPNTWNDGSIEASFYEYKFNFPTNQPTVTAPLLVGWNDYVYIQPFLPTDIGPTEGTQGRVKRSLFLSGGNATDTRDPGLVLISGGQNSSAGTWGDVGINTVGGDVNIGNSTSTTSLTGTINFANATVTNLTALYTPSTDIHWTDPNPTTVGEALDRLAAAIYAVNSNSSI